MAYKHILIVDDDPLIHAVCQAFFKRRQAQSVLSAMSAMRGLEMIDEHPEIDLVVSDLNMPDVDGLQFMRLLMERRFRKPLIIASGEEGNVIRSAHNLAKAHGLPVIGRISKPFDPTELDALLLKPVETQKVRRAIATTEVTEADFHSALQLGEIRAHLQPLINCKTGEVVSAEALARWTHPDYGPITPDAFIPMLEDAGLIPLLTDYILKDALTTKIACAERGYDIRIAVNTDAQTVKQLDFPDRVSAIAREAGVPNEDIKLELTERSLIDDGPGSMEVLTRLRIQRFGVSIDDFGTGNSNLKQLCTFPFTELKIDKAFLEGVGTDHAKTVCMNAIVSLAASLELETVAEGIETAEDFALIRRVGVKYAQGHYISKPLEPKDFLPWLVAREPNKYRRKSA